MWCINALKKILVEKTEQYKKEEYFIPKSCLPRLVQGSSQIPLSKGGFEQRAKA